MENPEDPGDAYRRILNVKIQETLNLIDQYDVSFKMQLYQEIRSIVSSLFEDANLEFGNIFEALDIFEAEAKADMMEEEDVDEKQEEQDSAQSLSDIQSFTFIQYLADIQNLQIFIEQLLLGWHQFCNTSCTRQISTFHSTCPFRRNSLSGKNL